MGFYNGRTKDDSAVFTESLESIVLTEEVTPVYGEDFMEAAMIAVGESEYNYSEIMKSIGIAEATALAETGEPMVYTEGTVQNVIESVKKFILKIWEKVKALFKRFMMMLDSFIKTDKEFIKKYKGDIARKMNAVKDFKYSGYKFTIDEHADIDKVGSSIDGVLKVKASEAEKYDELLEKARGAAIGKSGDKLSGSDYTKELHKLFRNDKSEKEELKDISWSEIISELESAAVSKKTVNKAYNDFQKKVNAALKELKAKETAADKKFDGKDTSEIDQINHDIKATKDMFALIQTYNGALLTAVKDRSRQYKAMCTKLVASSVKSKVNEGWQHPMYENASFLEGIKFK